MRLKIIHNLLLLGSQDAASGRAWRPLGTRGTARITWYALWSLWSHDSLNTSITLRPLHSGDTRRPLIALWPHRAGWPLWPWRGAGSEEQEQAYNGKFFHLSSINFAATIA